MAALYPRKFLHTAFALLLMLGATGHAHASTLASLGAADQFGILGLENGTVIINSATSIVGDVGYSAGVVSTTNQKVDLFDGTAYVSSTANFSYTAATFVPTGGIQTGPAVDQLLAQANADALAAAAHFASLAATHSLGALGDNDDRTVTSVGDVNVVSLTSLNYKSDTLTLVGRPGHDDIFIFNVAGNFNFSQSTIELHDVLAYNVIFNFLNPASISINKDSSVFNGVILAPTGSVDYHNPATFDGAIIAKDINLHSDFNLTHTVIPEPSSLALLALGALTLIRRPRRAA